MKRVVGASKVKVHKGKAVAVGRDAGLGVLKVAPVDLRWISDTEKEALRRFYQELLDTITYPVYLYSRQTPADLASYADGVSAKEGFDRIRESYGEYCRKISEFVETEHFVVVRITSDDGGDTEKRLYRRVQEVKSTLSGGEWDVTQVTDDELVAFLKDHYNRLPEPTRKFCAVENRGFDEYRKLVYVDSYPSSLGIGWPCQLLRVNGLVDVTQVLRPVDVDRAVKKLRRQSEKLDAEIGAFLQRGYKGVNKLEKDLDDVEWFLDLLARQECHPVRYGVYITAHGSTPRQAETTFDRVTSRLRRLQIEYQEPGFRNDYAFYADSPFYRDYLNETLLMPSVSAATGLPFGTQPFEDSSGILYGLAAVDDTPVLLDRFSLNSHSMAVMGEVGSGKSYAAKLELLRSRLVYPDLRIVVIDPKKEYRPVVETLGGEMRRITPGEQYSFDGQVLGFEVEERGDIDDVAALSDLLQQIYSAVSKDRDRTLVLVDEAHILLDDDDGRDVLNRFVLEARDINTAVHMVTQSGSHFTQSQKGRDILNQVAGMLLFRHDDTTDSMVDYFTLSDREEADLLQLRGGEGVEFSEAFLHVSEMVNCKIRIGSAEHEHRLVESRQNL